MINKINQLLVALLMLIVILNCNPKENEKNPFERNKTTKELVNDKFQELYPSYKIQVNEMNKPVFWVGVTKRDNFGFERGAVYRVEIASDGNNFDYSEMDTEEMAKRQLTGNY